MVAPSGSTVAAQWQHSGTYQRADAHQQREEYNRQNIAFSQSRERVFRYDAHELFG